MGLIRRSMPTWIMMYKNVRWMYELVVDCRRKEVGCRRLVDECSGFQRPYGRTRVGSTGRKDVTDSSRINDVNVTLCVTHQTRPNKSKTFIFIVLLLVSNSFCLWLLLIRPCFHGSFSRTILLDLVSTSLVTGHFRAARNTHRYGSVSAFQFVQLIHLTQSRTSVHASF